MPNLGPMELVIIAVVVLVLFGGSRLAGLGKSTGRALREFKEETKSLSDDAKKDRSDPAARLDELDATPSTPAADPARTDTRHAETVDAEIVDRKRSEA